MEERKRCLTCNRFLLAFNNHYLHPDSPCNGIKDYIFIEATIEDDFLHKKFIELYGEPKIDDYDRLKIYEDKIEAYRKLADKYEVKLSNPIVKLTLKLIHILQHIYYRKRE